MIMQTIEMDEYAKDGCHQIHTATGPITINFHGELNLEVFTLTMIARAIRNHPRETIASIRGCLPLMAMITADKIKLVPMSLVYIVPISTIEIQGDGIATKKELDRLDKINVGIRKLYEKYPKLQALFDDGDEHFLTKEDLIANGINVVD